MEIPIHYDPLIGKLITFHENRQGAINRMIRAIDEYRITGIETTLPFCKFVMQHPAFQEGQFDTKFVERFFLPDTLDAELSNEEMELSAAIAVFFFEKTKAMATGPGVSNKVDPAVSNWKNRKNND